MPKDKFPDMNYWLGLDRFRELGLALSGRDPVQPQGNWGLLGVGCLFSVYFLAHFFELFEGYFYFIGISFALLGILTLRFRWFPKTNESGSSISESLRDFKGELSKVHTAFAFGCAPAIIAFLIAGDFQLKNNLIGEVFHSSEESNALASLGFAIIIASWSSVGEEIVFRGGLLSGIRRLNLALEPETRDTIALIVSSAFFGLAHYPTWGLGVALPLGFIGYGLGLGYLASKESLLPVIFYHFCFNFLSILVALLS